MSQQSSDSAAIPSERPNPDLYPDLAAAGSLAAALEQVADEMGLDLGEVERSNSDPNWATVTGAAPGLEYYSIWLAAQERRFLIEGWSRGVSLIHGTTDDLHAVTKAAAAWRTGATLRELRDLCPFITFNELAEAHERGPADAVTMMWRLVREEMAEDIPFPAVRDLVEAAYAEPKLRQLYPVTSHWSLHFSTCTGFPFTWVVPFVDPLRDGRYRVCGPHRGTVVGEADTAEQAIALVVGHMPSDIGPAVVGTADDLAGS
ncbi:hypothetical protein GCM10009745_68050 [Kribbella yunnanensis]|uniref:Uncharacterized protein n=1 Tax=Kribbella yunnanensis TaxID=190194 RepID=A0ABN2IRN2_9ACTN